MGAEQARCLLLSMLSASKPHGQCELPSETTHIISAGRASGFQTQSHMREKFHNEDTQWIEEVALMHGFGICQCHG